MNIKELIGLDVEWFAIDRDGIIGIFFTGINLAIPMNAVVHLEEHNLISKEFNLPHLGSLDVWNDYAAYGLFVYDYKVHGGPYMKMATPQKPIEEALRSQIMQIKNLPVIDKSFATENTIEVSIIRVDK